MMALSIKDVKVTSLEEKLMYAILEEILSELKGLRADLRANNEASDAWVKEQAEYQRRVAEEIVDRGRRMELRGIMIPRSGSN